jgi:hypothetical protein
MQVRRYLEGFIPSSLHGILSDGQTLVNRNRQKKTPENPVSFCLLHFLAG